MAGFLDFLSSSSGQAAAAGVLTATASGDFVSAAAALGRAGVQRVTIRTQVSPPVTITPFEPSPPGPPNPLLAFLKPSIEVETPGGPITVAPYGPPTGDYFPWLVAGLAVVVIGLVTLIAWIARRF